MSLKIDLSSSQREKVIRLMNWRRYKEAVSEAEQWIRNEPDNADSYAILARIYLKSDQFENAIYWSKESLRHDPENTMAWYVQVCVYYTEDKEKQFLEAVKEALRIDPYESYYFFLRFN